MKQTHTEQGTIGRNPARANDGYTARTMLFINYVNKRDFGLVTKTVISVSEAVRIDHHMVFFGLISVHLPTLVSFRGIGCNPKL